MFDRLHQTKQAKAARHEIGQQKCKIYQRSHSSKFRSAGSGSLQPSTGQFIVKANKELKLTTNIEQIVKDRNPNSASQILSLNASRRTSFMNQPQNLPPFRSEPQVCEALQFGSSLEKLKSETKVEKSSYLVKSRAQTPKYTQGYRIVKLEAPSKLKISTQARKTEIIAQQTDKEAVKVAHFLPVEYYLLDEENPKQLMEKYRIKESNYVLGYSRWYDLNGNSNWKKCRVLGFNNDIERWEIEWLHNNRKKEVSRINLYFEGESKAIFERRVALAQKYRTLSQVYYKYNNEINDLQGKTNELSQATLIHILSKIQPSYSSGKVEKLIDEVKKMYIRSNHQAEFNASLPFDTIRRREYESHLPKCLFMPNEQYKLRYNISTAPSFDSSSTRYFHASRALFKERTSLNINHRLLILEYLNHFEQKMQKESFVFWKQDKAYSIDEVIKLSANKVEEMLRQVIRAVCDIEHHIGHELDQIYVDKKTKSELFQSSIQKYGGFLSMITMRLEEAIKCVLFNTLQKLTLAFKVEKDKFCQSEVKIELVLRKKEDKVYFEVTPSQIEQKILAFLRSLFKQLECIPCPTKSYIKQTRKGNVMRIIYQNSIQNQSPCCKLDGMLISFSTILKENCLQLVQLALTIGEVVDQFTAIANETKKQVQKRYTFAQILGLSNQIRDLEKKFDRLISESKVEDDRRIRVNNFIVKVDEVVNKLHKNFNEIRRELYRIVLDKILKDNEKIEKFISSLQERLEKSPTNIIQMLSLEKLIREEATDELDKIYTKIKEIPQKIAVLESVDFVEYKDYEACNKIYVMPIKLKQNVLRVRRQLESTYRKKFGEELNKDATRVLQTTRQCGDELLSCLKIETLEEMCDKFLLFSNLNERLLMGIKEAELINDRQEAMTWARTDFTKLFNLKEDFAPYFSLISYAKVYQVHLELLSNGPFNQIDYPKLDQQLNETNQQIAKIRQYFQKNPKMSRITCQVQDKYNNFADNLPLIKSLRNADLRERHWSTIRQILTVNPLDEEISLKNLINLGAKLHLSQLEEISSIASRELLYEKKLIKLKRQWKEIKLILAPDSESLRIILNIKELRHQVESDIYQIQEILSASFIKFLESQIICWRNQVLYKAYQLLEKWQKVQNEVCLVAAIFNKPKAKNDLPGEYIRFQILQKIWRGLCSQIESQPWFADFLQGKAYDLLTSMESSIERIKKHLYSFFEDKKREYARLGCISDDQFMNLLSCDETDPRENAVFQQTVRKCFQNIRTLVRNERHQIVKIKTKSNQEIPFTEMSYVEKLVEYILPNELIMQLEKKIQRQLKSSLQSIVKYPNNHITQVLLLYQRLNFTLSIEDEIIKNHCISAAFIRQIELYRDDLVSIVLQSSPTPKNQCELLQALYHLQITSSLWQQSSLDVSSFSWLSQPRTYLKNEQYYVEVGILSELYGFEIVDLDNIITEEWSARIFCSYAGVLRQKGFCLIQAGCTVGKTSSIRKLAALFGHKEFILDSNPLVSPRNLLEYIRMAASGMWVILRNVQRLTQPQFSLLSRNLEVCWYQNIAHPRQQFSIEGTGIAFKSQSLKIFATIDNNIQKYTSQMHQVTEKTKKHFRVIYLPRINAQYVVQVKLLVLGIVGANSGRICAIVNYLKQKLCVNSNFPLSFSDIYLINKLFSLVISDSKSLESNRSDDLIDNAFLLMIDELVREESIKENLRACLNQNFKIRSVTNSSQQIQKYKEKFSQQKLYYNQNLLQVYHSLSESLNTHNFIILLGPINSGKSHLISMLLHEKKIELTFICPNAYEIEDLYGNDYSNGVICSLIEDVLKKLKNQGCNKNGILLDGEIDLWMEPLAGVVSSGHIIQPNGNTLLIQEDLKFVFECKQLSNLPPTFLLYSSVLFLQEPIKWQNLFTHYLNTKFNAKYQLPALIKFLELFIPYIVDPIIEFYESTCSQYITNKNHCYIPSNSIILSLLNLFETLLDHHFLEVPFELLNEKICSDCFNLFVMAVVWTVGGVLPEQSRKSFTRHFKYLIKRAVQVNIQGVNKESLPDDDHDLFKVFYSKDKWAYWNPTVITSDKHLQMKTLYIQKPEDIGLSFIVRRYLQKSYSVYLLGTPSSQKVAFLESIITRLNVEVFNIRRLNFNPNSKVSLLKKLILKEMSKEKYSFDFNGFVHGKKTLVSIRDLNLPLIKQENSFKVGLLQFIRHYYVTNGWYLKDISQHYSFKNIVFCGTVNIKHPLPINLQKYSNLLFRSSHKEDLVSVLKVLLDNSSLKLHSDSLVSLMTNLHYAVCRELSSVSLVGIETSDALCITRSLIRMGDADKLQIFRRWMFLSEKIYQEKLISEQAERLFYLINNVLMEQEKIRYKSIRHNPSLYETYFAINMPIYHNMKSLRKEIEQKCSQVIEIESVVRQKKSKRKQSKIQEFVTSELNYKVNEFVNHLTQVKQHKSAGLKDSFIKMIAHLINTFELQTSFLFSLSIPSIKSFSSLDLQESLEIVAVIRQAKLVCIKLGQPEVWNNSSQNGTWKDIILGVIEQILSSIERGQQLKQIIMYLDDFASENDYIIDDLMNMKRLHMLPFSEEVSAMLQYFLDNFKQLHLAKIKPEQNNEEYYGIESKAKLKQKKYELERKQREKNLQSLELSIINKLKFVININEQSIDKAKENKVLEQYSDALREFSILNLKIYQQVSKTKRWKSQVLQPSSFGEIKSKTIITDLNRDDQDEESEVIEQSNDIDIRLNQNEQAILEHIVQKMTYKNCFLFEEHWLRGRENNLKLLYMNVKERLTKLCHENIEFVSRRVERVTNIQELSQIVERKLSKIEAESSSFQQQQELIRRQKHERQLDFEQVMVQNRTTQKNLLGLKREKQQLQLGQESFISPSRKIFLLEKDSFIEVIKEGREKKITFMNHFLRVYLQSLGILIQKKIKKDEELHKEMIKDLFSPIGNAKIIKKVSSIGSSGFYNVAQRVTLRIKESIIEIEKEKQDRRFKNEESQKDEKYLNRLIKGLSSFFARLIDFFDASQQKDVKQCARRLNENERATDKIKQNNSKTLKSKEYLTILEKYEEIKVKENEFEESKNRIKNIKKVCQFLKAKLLNIQNMKYPQAQKCSIEQSHVQCTFLCWIKENLLKQKENILEIQEDIESYAFTIAVKLYYVSEHCENDILNIMGEFQKHRQNSRTYNTIYYTPTKLINLSSISTIAKATSHSSFQDPDKTFRNIKRKQELLEKYFQSGNLISLIQFTPGVILIGVENGSLKLNKIEGSTSMILQNSGIRDLYETFIISSGQLTKWLRSRNQQSYHKVCLSSRVTLENKCFMKSVKSIIVEGDEQSCDKQVCMVMVENREEVKSLIKVLKREPISKDLTVVLITENQNVTYEEDIYSITFKHEDLKDFSKKVERLLINIGDKSESTFNLEFNAVKDKKNYLKTSINYALDMQNETFFQAVTTALDYESDVLTTFLENIKKLEGTQTKETNKQTAFQQLIKWISGISSQLENKCEVLKLEENLLRQSIEKRKLSNLNDKIIKYIVTILELVMAFQRSQILPKMLSTNKYLLILEEIFERNKQINKKGGNSVKLFSEIKLYLWNCIGPMFTQHSFCIFLIFIAAEQEEAYNEIQIANLIQLCLDNYEEGIQELKMIDNFSFNQSKSHVTEKNSNIDENSSPETKIEPNLLNLYLQTQTSKSHSSIEQSEEEQNSQLTDKIRRKLKKLETVLNTQDISLSLQNNVEEWISFLTNINENTNRIPENLLTQSNIFIFFYFLSLIKPTLCLKWLEKNDFQGYHRYNNKSGELLIGSKKNQIKLYEFSYFTEWSPLTNLLLYEFQAVNTQNVLLVNANSINLIETCVNCKINYAYYDFTTVFWEMNKAFELRHIEERQQANFNEIAQGKRESAHYTKQYQNLLDNLKISLKNETWIIINLNYYQVANTSVHEYFKKINDLINSTLEPDNNRLQQFPEGISKRGHGSDKQMRSMVLYLVDLNTAKNESEKEQESRSRQKIINSFLHMPKSFIYFENESQAFRAEQMYTRVRQFKKNFYSIISRSPKSKRQYEKLEVSQKAILYEYIFISHRILQDYSIKRQDSQPNIKVEYVEELISRIYGCTAIIKTLTITNEHEEEMLVNYQDKNKKQAQNTDQMEDILFKIEEYIILMIEYTFELNYKTSLLSKKVHCTLQYVVEIKKFCQNLKNLSLQSIITQLHEEQKQQNDEPKQWQFQESDGLFQRLTTFHSQGLPFEIEQIQKDPSFREQQDKLLQIFIQESKLSFSDKIQEISSFGHDQFNEVKNMIERLKLYDTKTLFTQYKSLWQDIENNVEDLESKYAKLISKSKYKGTFTQNQNPSTVITNALTQLFNRETVTMDEIDQRWEINELEQIFLRLLICEKKKVLSISAFLEAQRDLVKQYIEIEFHSLHLGSQHMSQISEDEEENLRNSQEQQIKSLIKKKIQTKVLVERLIKKIGILLKKIDPEFTKGPKFINFSEQRKIYQSIQLIQRKYSQMQLSVKENINNYFAFRKQHKQKLGKLEDSLYTQFNFNDFVFSFNQYDLSKIVEIMKIMHAKRHHQEFHLLQHKLQLTSLKRMPQPNKTIFYFRGFKLINAKYHISANSINLDAAHGTSVDCNDLLVEVVIEEIYDVDSDEEEELKQEKPGYILYKCPFYIKESNKNSESRERVHILIKQLVQFQIIKNNIYLIT